MAATAAGRPRLVVPIEVFSDTLCPWCYVEKHSLEAALRRHEARHPDVGFEVVWRSFCPNPLLKTSTMPPPPGCEQTGGDDADRDVRRV